MRRGICTAAGTCAAMLALAPVAQADHHLVKITEVFPGQLGNGNTDFVELRMYSSLQNNFDPAAKLVFYDAKGVASDPFALNDVAGSANQSTALWGTDEMEAFFMVGPDTTFQADVLDNAAGGVCLTSTVFVSPVDCIAWGGVSIVGAGTPAPAIPDGASLERSISRGCNTLLEASDDTNSSAADFVAVEPNPEENGTIEPKISSCPQTAITKKPAAESVDRSPVFRFSGGTAGYRCKVDRDPFEECGSPFRPGQLSLGRHKIQVKATENDGSIDGTPEKFNWNIIRR